MMRSRRACAAIATGAVMALVGCGSNGSSSKAGASGTGSVRLGPALTHTAGPVQRDLADATGLPASTLSAADVQATLDAHNAWRSRYNEPPLSWDARLASLAQDWSNTMAQTGNFDHRPNNSEGENIFSGTGTYTPNVVVDDWGSEVSSFHADTNSCDPNAQCGHYTQLVWASTSKVGCGSATASDGTVYWTCNYDPAGNLDGVGPFDLKAQQQAASGQ